MRSTKLIHPISERVRDIIIIHHPAKSHHNENNTRPKTNFMGQVIRPIYFKV